jgi:hypothetical protein
MEVAVRVTLTGTAARLIVLRNMTRRHAPLQSGMIKVIRVIAAIGTPTARTTAAFASVRQAALKTLPLHSLH